MKAFEILGDVLYWYVGLCTFWFIAVLVLDHFYLKSSKNPNGDAGLAVLAVALLPLAPIAKLVDAVTYVKRKVRQ